VTVVDTNVLLDLVTDDPTFADWSVAQLETASLNGDLIINDVIYAELSVRYGTKEELDIFVYQATLRIVPFPRAALFLAGKVFAQYRKSGGTGIGVLPDFFIGAHAAVLELPLLTREAGRYSTCFPSLLADLPHGKSSCEVISDKKDQDDTGDQGQNTCG
jgi:predicted nucleic acid-binding protein